MPADMKNCLQRNNKRITPLFYCYLPRDQYSVVIFIQSYKIFVQNKLKLLEFKNFAQGTTDRLWQSHQSVKFWLIRL